MRVKNPAFKTWYGVVSTFFGVGNFTNMPGTLGTFAAMIILLLLREVGVWLLAATIIIGTIASDRYAKATGTDDPGEVVIDEVAGYWMSMLWLDPSYAIGAFFLFRVVDIIKPFPVSFMERLPGGIGIMADDICGGIMVNLIMRFFYWVFFAGGLLVIYGYLGIGG